jgi:dolichol-phosphate mannosyltransferase
MHIPRQTTRTDVRAYRIRPAIQRLVRPLRFGLVGLSGLVVNTAILWLLAHGAGLPIPLAGVLATELAILNNFILNDRWTFWASAHQRSLGRRLLRFNGVALGGLVISTGLLTLLTTYAHLHLLLANLLAVGSATGWNYVVNTRWTWRASRPARSQEEEVPA